MPAAASWASRDSTTPGARATGSPSWPRAPGVVESLEAQLAAAGIAPETQHVAAAEVAEPWIVQEDHRVLLLHRRVRDPEVERVFVGRPLEPEAHGLGERLRGGDVAIESDQDDVARRHLGPVAPGRAPAR